MRPPRALLSWLTLLCLPGAAAAEPIGDHVLRSYWDDDRRTIWSDVLRVHDDGRVETRRVVGGTVDGVAMIQIAQYRSGATAVRGPYVPTIGAMDGRLHWQNSCVFVTPDSAGSNDVPGDAELDALGAALAEWNDRTASCSYIKLMMLPPEPVEVGLDGKNILKFREEDWCRPATKGEPAECYDEEASAITTLCYVNDARRPDNGAILDVDVEVNSVDYAIAVGCETDCQTTGSGARGVADLQNTLTHEYGHVLGLDHTCWDGAPGNAPLTHEGTPAPSCGDDLPAEVTAATMYNFQVPREVSKRTLEADDIAGICDAYPIADDPELCVPVDIDFDGGCCAVASAPARRRHDRTALVVALLAALLLTARACSRSRRP